MFLGEFRHTIDEKGRLTIPAKFRGLLAAGMVVTRGFDRNLMAYDLQGWEELAERVKSLPISDPSARDIARSHGGDIAIGESSMGGLRAIIRLPL